MTVSHELFMQRCIDLAQKSSTSVKSNPQVGCVIVYNGKIISEGYHRNYGGAHAEIEAIQNSTSTDVLSKSTLYVTLEPCNHHGKTPPCVKAIISSNIPRVVIGCRDPNEMMQGKSIEILKQNNVDVIENILHNECMALIQPFIQNLKGLPFITIKFARTDDGFIGVKNSKVQLSNAVSNIFTHKLRTENDAILVGTNTAIIDNPRLTTRNFPGKNPIRIVLDQYERIPKNHFLLKDDLPTWIFTSAPSYEVNQYKTVCFTQKWTMSSIMKQLYLMGINRLLVEGGRKVINSVIKENLWNEAFIISTPQKINQGIRAPLIKGKLHRKLNLDTDVVYSTNSQF